jgi:two-component system, sensor histidine kinase
MHGYEATHRIREAERLNASPRMPILALTANAFKDDVDRCAAAGMDAHLAKPHSTRQLRPAVAPRLLGRMLRHFATADAAPLAEWEDA